MRVKRQALHGDVPAVRQTARHNKSADERNDLITLLAALPAPLQRNLLALWDDYENAVSP